MTLRTVCGILNVDKPSGITSRRVVDKVARLAKGQKVGHAGTLDPLATGVLLVAVGPATRLIEYLQRQPKQYRALIRFGARSATGDAEGPIHALPDAAVPALDAIQAALPAFLGRIQQRPPAYSAVHVAGRRAYELARRGRAVVPQAKTVEVHRLDILSYRQTGSGRVEHGAAGDNGAFDDLPCLELDVHCGSGTYMRSLARDLGERLGTAAFLQALRRTAVGAFRQDDAVSLNDLHPSTWRRVLQPPLAALPDHPRLTVPTPLLRRLAQGQQVALRPPLLLPTADPVPIHRLTAAGPPAAGADRTTMEVALLNDLEQLVAVALYDPHDASLRPVRVLAHAITIRSGSPSAGALPEHAREDQR